MCLYVASANVSVFSDTKKKKKRVLNVLGSADSCELAAVAA